MIVSEHTTSCSSLVQFKIPFLTSGQVAARYCFTVCASQQIGLAKTDDWLMSKLLRCKVGAGALNINSPDEFFD